MSKAATDATKQIDAKIEALKSSVDTEMSALKDIVTRMEKQIATMAATQIELVSKTNELLARPATGGSKAGAKKPAAAAARKLVDSEGNPVTSAEWFKYQWCNNYAEFKKQYMTSRHEKAVEEHMKDPKYANLSGEKATKERMTFFWQHFVLKDSATVDNDLRAKISAGYKEFKDQFDAQKKATPAAASEKPAPTKGKAPAPVAKAGKKTGAKKQPEPEPEEEEEEEEVAAEEAPADEAEVEVEEEEVDE